MPVDAVLFLLIATLVATSAVGVVVSPSLVRSGVWLLFTLLGVALCYLLLGAEFLGAAQLMIYVGGTLVLIVFGVMLTAGGPFATLPTPRLQWIGAMLVALGLFAGLVMISLQLGARHADRPNSLPGVGVMGLSFLGVPSPDDQTQRAYLLPFEILSVHLLVVLIGAAYLARAKSRTPARSQP